VKPISEGLTEDEARARGLLPGRTVGRLTCSGRDWVWRYPEVARTECDDKADWLIRVGDAKPRPACHDHVKDVITELAEAADKDEPGAEFALIVKRI